MKLKVLLSSVILATTLTGCATSAFDPSKVEYQSDSSYAKNITNHFGHGRVNIKDQRVPEGVDYSQNIALNTIGHAAGFSLPQGLNLSNLSSLGLGFLFAVGTSLGTTEAERDAIMGYVPVAKAKSADEAAQKMRTQLAKELQKIVQRQFPKAKVLYGEYYRDAEKLLILDQSAYVANVEIRQKDIGCDPIAADGNYDIAKACYFTIRFAQTNNYKTPQQIPAFISKKQEMGWFISPVELSAEDYSTTLSYHFGSDVKIDESVKYNVMPQLAKKLPNNMFIYLSSERNEEGKQMPPMLLDNKKVHFFVTGVTK